MFADSWEDAEALLADAAGVAPPARAALLDERCAHSLELRAEVESLLAALEDGHAFLEPEGPPPIMHASFAPGAYTRPGVGTDVGPYRLVERIAEGGMGTVFRAERADGEFRHEIAVKIVAAPDPSGIRRFRAERQSLAALQHPHIVTLLDGGALPSGHAYLAMEHVRGVAITTYCRERRLNLEGRLRLFHQVTLAVHHAHERHIVHRDIKPSNVLVTPDGVPKVLDFGIAKLLDDAAAGAAAGATIPGLGPLTPDYASPEQFRGLPTTPASDVYALGVLLFEMLTGTKPYVTTGRPFDEVLDLVLADSRPAPSAATGAEADLPYPLVSLRGDIDAIVLKAMANAPEERYTSAGELAGDVMRHMDGVPVAARRRKKAAEPGRIVTMAARAAALIACAALALATIGELPHGKASASAPAAPGASILSPHPGKPTIAAAREAYERGRRIWRTRTGLAGAIAEYRRAIAIDPGFALAHVALADTYAVQASPSPEAEREVVEAFRLEPDLGEAHASQGFIRMFHYWDWAGAEAALRRAVALAPDYAQAHQWLGSCLMLTRRFDEARASLERAERLDPGSPSILLDLGLLAYYSGDDLGATRYCEQARAAEDVSYHPADDCLVRVYQQTGRYREAWEMDEWMLGTTRPTRGSHAQRLRDGTRLWLEKTVPYARGEVIAAGLVNPNMAYRMAEAFARLGDREAAIAWLDTAAGRHAFLMPYANVDPVFASLRDGGGFRRILARMGLASP